MTITTADAKAFCQIETSADDALVATLIEAAVAHVERITGTRFNATSYNRLISSVDGPVVLTPHPVTAVSAIEQVSGATVTNVAAFFDVDLTARPAKVVPVERLALQTGERLRITYTAGFATIPADLRLGVLQLVAHWYDNRQAAVVGAVSGPVALTMKTLASTWQGLRLA